MPDKVDIKENRLLELDKSGELLGILLLDMTKSTDKSGCLKPKKSRKNIIWATSGYGHKKNAQILMKHITGENGDMIQPRVKKDKVTQKLRTKSHAEVFTPSWIVEKQVKLCEIKTDMKTIDGLECYLKRTWLEITCGEAPYIANRYDVTSGKPVSPAKRVGFLDRKLQALNKSEFAADPECWFDFAKMAVKSCYGFDFQGDNVLLARENVLETVRDFYKQKFKKQLTDVDKLCELAKIISWNIWQMDGLKFTIPFSDDFAKIKDWQVVPVESDAEGTPTLFVDIVSAGEQEALEAERERRDRQTGRGTFDFF